MSVSRILETKGRAVITVEPGHSLIEAGRLLAEHRIGAVVVCGPDRRVEGILSERDIVRAVAKGGGGALADKVADHMTTRVITCTAAMSMNQVMEIMTSGKFRHLPVVENGRLDGMISIGDVVKNRLAQLEYESQTLREYIGAS
ncbi:MAG: CBS domain-containing protein [Proteobacteria bacterium]|nr:CBS domain-containing protein [Pseudomonadota bacterium]